MRCSLRKGYTEIEVGRKGGVKVKPILKMTVTRWYLYAYMHDWIKMKRILLCERINAKNGIHKKRKELYNWIIRKVNFF